MKTLPANCRMRRLDDGHYLPVSDGCGMTEACFRADECRRIARARDRREIASSPTCDSVNTEELA